VRIHIADDKIFTQKQQRKKAAYWADIENRRKFFESMAMDLGFDPLQPSDWKKAKNADVIKKKASHVFT